MKEVLLSNRFSTEVRLYCDIATCMLGLGPVPNPYRGCVPDCMGMNSFPQAIEDEFLQDRLPTLVEKVQVSCVGKKSICSWKKLQTLHTGFFVGMAIN